MLEARDQAIAFESRVGQSHGARAVRERNHEVFRRLQTFGFELESDGLSEGQAVGAELVQGGDEALTINFALDVDGDLFVGVQRACFDLQGDFTVRALQRSAARADVVGGELFERGVARTSEHEHRCEQRCSESEV